MGSAISCDVCTSAATSSVVNLSDNLMLRLVEGIEPPKTEVLTSAEDSDWIDKIKCLDDAHTAAYGLTVREIDALMKRLEQRLKIEDQYCPPDVVIGCYKFNNDCTLNCSEEINSFINCLDAERLQKLKVMMEKEMERREKAKREKQKKIK